MKNQQMSFSKNLSSNINQNSSSTDKRKIISLLQTSLQQQIYKRQQLQLNLLQYRKRNIFIQKQFARILQKVDNNIAIHNGHTNDGAQIWNKLIDQIQIFNKNSQRILEKRCVQIQFLMTRRINDILQNTQRQIKKHKKLSQEQYKQVKQQIKQALNIAKNIQNQNQKLRKQNKQYLFKLNVLNQQKRLLIQQLNQKKNRLKKILKDIYQNQNQRKYVSVNNRSKIDSRVSSRNNSPSIKFIGQPSFKEIHSTLDNPESPRKISSLTNRKNNNQMIMKTQGHIKICLQREKRKNNELKSIIVNFNNKIKDIGLLIEMNKKDMMALSSQQRFRSLESILQNIKLKLFIPNFQYKNGTNQLDQQEIMKMMENY